MPDILIISPDPEARRMLQLAFDLAGQRTATAADPADVRGGWREADVLLVDIVDESADRWDAARRALALSRGRERFVALLLPRGRDGAKLPKGVEGAGLLVRKPYELLGLVERVKALAAAAPKRKTSGGITSPRRSSSSRRTSRPRS